MAMRKKAAVKCDGNRGDCMVNFAVINDQLATISQHILDTKNDIAAVKEQFITLNGKVQKHETNLAIIDEQDLEARMEKQETFRSKAMGGLAVLAAINVIFLILNFVHQAPKP